MAKSAFGNAAEKKVDDSELPALQLVAFDLDDTVWAPEMWLLNSDRFSKSAKTKEVSNGDGSVMRLLGDTQDLLLDLSKRDDITVAYVSRTTYPKRAAKCLKLMEVDTKSGMT